MANKKPPMRAPKKATIRKSRRVQRPDTDNPVNMLPAEAACEDPFPAPVDDGDDDDADFGETP